MSPETTTAPEDPPSENNEWGNTIDTPPPTSCTRLFFQNINGIPHHDLTTTAHILGQFMNTYYISYLGLTETNLDWAAPKVKPTIISTLKKYNKQQHINTAQTSIHFDTPYQPGGVMSTITAPWVQAI